MAKIGERAREKQQELFAGRNTELETFRDLLKQEPPDYNIISYTGIGGIGKTTLLTMLCSECQKRKIPFARVDATEQTTPVNMLVSLWQQLGEHIETDRFDSEKRQYLDTERTLQSKREIKPEFLNRISYGFLFGGTRYLGTTTANTPASATTDYDEELRAIYTAIEKVDADFFINPQDRLTQALINDINKYAEDSTICIFLDTFERIVPSLEEWFIKLIPEFEENFILTVAGRTPLSEQWSMFELVTKPVELPEFEYDDTKKLLALNDITTNELIDQIHSITGGLPLGIKLCIQRVQAGKSETLKRAEKASVVEEITKSLLRDIPSSVRDLIEQCAVLHWFNKDMLDEIEDTTPQKVDYETIQKLPFIRTHTDGLTLHDRVRDFLNEDVRRHRPARYQELHGKAAKYFEEQLNNPKSKLDDKRAIIELIYHKVRADETAGIRYAIERFNDAADLFQADMCDLIYDAVKNANFTEVHQLWVEYFAGVTAKLRVSSREAARILKNVLDKPASNLDAQLRVYAGRWLAGSLWFAGEFHDVIRYATETRNLSARLSEDGNSEMKQYEHRAMETTGLALDRLGRFDEGIAVMLDLVESSQKSGDRRGEGWGYLSAGYFSWHSGDWDGAEDYLKKCLGIAVEIGSDYMEVYPLGHLGLLYAGIGSSDSQYFDLARNYLSQCKVKALPATSREMDCKSHQNLGQLELFLGNLDEGIKQASTATQLATRMQHPYYEADSLRVWGELLIDKGEYQEASAKLVESTEIANRIGAVYISSRSQIQLYRIKVLGGDISNGLASKVEFQTISNYISPYKFYHQSALLKFYRSVELFNNRHTEAVHILVSACFDALRYNRFWCDKILNLIQSYLIPSTSDHIEETTELLRKAITIWREQKLGDEMLETFERKQRSRGSIAASRTSFADQVGSMVSQLKT